MNFNKVFLERTFIFGDVIEDTENLLREDFQLDTYDEDGDYISLEIIDKSPLDFPEMGYLVNVDTVLTLVSSMKKVGVTHVAIRQYGDEHSYELNGYKVNPIDQNDALEKYKRTYVESLEEKRVQLQLKLQNLDNEIKSLSEDGNG